MTEEVKELILTESVRYGNQYLEDNEDHLRAHIYARAHDLSAIFLTMGILGYPSIRYKYTDTYAIVTFIPVTLHFYYNTNPLLLFYDYYYYAIISY